MSKIGIDRISTSEKTDRHEVDIRDVEISAGRARDGGKNTSDTIYIEVG